MYGTLRRYSTSTIFIDNDDDDDIHKKWFDDGLVYIFIFNQFTLNLNLLSFYTINMC